MLQKLAILNRRYRTKWGIVRDVRLPRMFLPKFWGDPGQSTCLYKWPLLVDNQGRGSAKYW